VGTVGKRCDKESLGGFGLCQRNCEKQLHERVEFGKILAWSFQVMPENGSASRVGVRRIAGACA
jgi:hypothetical protein